MMKKFEVEYRTGLGRQRKTTVSERTHHGAYKLVKSMLNKNQGPVLSTRRVA